MIKQKVVVVHDTSKDVCWPAVKGILHGFNLKHGDELTLVGVFHVNNSSFMKAGKLFGCNKKSKLNSIFGYNPLMEEELAKKKEQCYKHIDRRILSKQCEMEKIKFHMELLAGHPRKVVAAEAAINLGATWVILDREMKKHKGYFMDKLSCGISRMKRNNSILLLRGPISTEKTSSSQILYDEMIPGESWEELLPSTHSEHVVLSKGSASRQRNDVYNATTSCSLNELEKSSSLLDLLNEGNPRRTIQTASGKMSPYLILEDKKTAEAEISHNIALPNERKKQHVKKGDRVKSIQREEGSENHKCSVCSNMRPKMEWQRDFSYKELHEATKGFSKENFLSEGGFGSVYRGQLKDGMQIAVKHHKYGSLQGEKEFKSEVDVLSKARHQNLVMLLGSCSEGSRRLLVYEYVCNGSLDDHLSQDKEIPLTWEKRIKIALGAAKGLRFLHSQNIIHRDMSSKNILITHDHEALLGDFGLAKMQNDDSVHTSSHRVVGTVGYLAPEYAENGEVSTKMDVYSFGVILLQLITGLTMTDNELKGKSLVGWATPLLEEKNYPHLVDKRIMDSYDVHQLFCMVQVAEKCLRVAPDDRCAMEEVVIALIDIIREGNAI